MKTVFIAGATGYLGRYLCAQFHRRGWYVTALVRDAGRAKSLCADQLVEAQATHPDTLAGTMTGADLVISALGVTRRMDGLDYWDVDYQANLNLLREAEKARVGRFAYVHVLHADRMPDVPMVAAKRAFVARLQASDLPSTLIAPTGYFSDMDDVLTMAQSGWISLFGDGECLINPIHGADLASAIADAVEQEVPWLDIGGPDILSLNAIAQMASAACEKPSRIVHLPDFVRRALLRILPRITPLAVHGPAQFFLSAVALNMVGQPHGTHSLRAHFETHAASRTVRPLASKQGPNP